MSLTLHYLGIVHDGVSVLVLSIVMTSLLLKYIDFAMSLQSTFLLTD